MTILILLLNITFILYSILGMFIATSALDKLCPNEGERPPWKTRLKIFVIVLLSGPCGWVLGLMCWVNLFFYWAIDATDRLASGGK